MIRMLLEEFRESVDSSRIWLYLASSDIKTRFRRSKLGLAWPIIQQLAFSLGAGLIWATVFKIQFSEFVPFLTLGFALWAFISASLLEGCSSFVIAHGYLKQLPLSPSIFVLRTVATQLFYLGIGLSTALVILLFVGKLNIVGLALSIPGLFILVAFGYSCVSVFSYLGLRYRDLPHGLNGLLNLLFVLTPVIYPADVLAKKGIYFAVYANPLASIIEIVRDPILNNRFANFYHYGISIVFTLFLAILGAYLRFRWKRFIPFWS
jgi:ABC-type polysaccharide/polyol phosphate export permease